MNDCVVSLRHGDLRDMGAHVCLTTGLLHVALRCVCQTAATSRKEKTTPFGVNLMRSQVLYRAAQRLPLPLQAVYAQT